MDTAVHATGWVHGLHGQVLFTAPVHLSSPKVTTTFGHQWLAYAILLFTQQ